MLHHSKSTASPIDAVKSRNSRDRSQIATRQSRPPRCSSKLPQGTNFVQGVENRHTAEINAPHENHHAENAIVRDTAAPNAYQKASHS